jgi:hypothetical protein
MGHLIREFADSTADRGEAKPHDPRAKFSEAMDTGLNP